MDLLEDLLRARVIPGVRVEVAWEPGKSHQILKDVDRAAKRAARTMAYSEDHGYSPGTVARRRTPGSSAATPFEAAGQAVTIRIYRIRYVKMKPTSMYKFWFELWAEETNSFVAVYYAYVPVTLKISRNHCYEATFNRSPEFPIVEEMNELAECPG